MTQSADEVYQAALELDFDERTRVAHRLLASVHPEGAAQQQDADAAWRNELGARVDDVLSGAVALSTIEQTRAKARALLDDRHQ